jgi:hypothetical protein
MQSLQPIGQTKLPSKAVEALFVLESPTLDGAWAKSLDEPKIGFESSSPNCTKLKPKADKNLRHLLDRYKYPPPEPGSDHETPTRLDLRGKRRECNILINQGHHKNPEK